MAQFLEVTRVNADNSRATFLINTANVISVVLEQQTGYAIMTAMNSLQQPETFYISESYATIRQKLLS